MKRGFAATLILLTTTACDNVEWGGIDVRMESPPAASDTLRLLEPEAPPEPQGPVLPEGPVLFSAERMDEGRVALRAVGEIGPDTLIPLPLDSDQPGFTDLFTGTLLTPGTRFILFAEGVRVGSVQIDEVSLQPGRCAPEPVAEGIVEIVPEAAAARRYIALRESVAGQQVYRPFVDSNHNYDQRVAGLALASDAIASSGARYPGSVLEMRADMQAIALDGDPRGAFAATFLYQDALRVGPSLTQAAYSIFVLGVGGPVDYRMGFMDYQAVADGKGATRFFEQMDWDGDGESEVLLEVFGEDSRWISALDRRDGTWRRVYEPSCGTGA